MATLKELQDEATALEIGFNTKTTKAELEALIGEAKGEAPENVESTETEEGAEDEATQTLGENEQNDEPKLNKDGLEAGKELTPEEFAKYMAKQRAKK